MNDLHPCLPALDAEWLEPDGQGGFASGTVGGMRTRRYHALLLSARQPPGGRMVLVNGFDAVVHTPAGAFPLSTQRYGPGVIHPDGWRRLAAFGRNPWPEWRFQLEDGTRIRHELLVPRGKGVTLATWRLEEPRDGVSVVVRPFLSGRDYHALHHENRAFRLVAEVTGQRVVWTPYDGLPRIVSFANASYAHGPVWYRNFQYEEELERGLDAHEDLLCPGTLTWELSRSEAIWVLGTDDRVHAAVNGDATLAESVHRLRKLERQRRDGLGDGLARAADAYLVEGQNGTTVVAGYPWFTDWGRDTLVAMRGLCLATGRLAEAGEVLSAWASQVAGGLLPNRFTEDGGQPEYNSVDAALWYVVAAHEYLERRTARAARRDDEERTMREAVERILEGYRDGTRHGIRMDADGLLACGEPGVQLTWMDAKVGDWVVTPRIGKPVEVQALWINALRLAAGSNPRWRVVHDRALDAFRNRFWNAARACLFDVVDQDHVAGRVDDSLRPNQVLAVGGLPFALIEGVKARLMLEVIEDRLLTPLGLRSLAPGEPGYAARYQGGVRERDGAYHQGTVWPWLLGPFVEAWVRTRGGAAEVRREARRRFLDPLRAHLQEAGLGHISEIADAEAPHRPRGCPFQAWSVGEFLRLDRDVLHTDDPAVCRDPLALRRNRRIRRRPGERPGRSTVSGASGINQLPVLESR